MDGPVFFLPGSIEHVKKRHFVVDYALLAIRIFDGLAGGTSVRARAERAGRWIDNGGRWRGGPTHWVISRKQADGILGVSTEAKMPGEGGLGAATIGTLQKRTHRPGTKCAQSKQDVPARTYACVHEGGGTTYKVRLDKLDRKRGLADACERRKRRMRVSDGVTEGGAHGTHHRRLRRPICIP